MTTPNETIVRRFFTDALSHADWALLDTLVAVIYREHEIVPGLPPVRDSLKQKYDLLRQGCPDLRFEVDELLTSGDRVSARVTVHGTNTAPFLGRPATGRAFTADKLSIFRINDGQIVEHWGVFDQMAMLVQLGQFPMQAR
jgi:predicted ester cyclase